MNLYTAVQSATLANTGVVYFHDQECYISMSRSASMQTNRSKNVLSFSRYRHAFRKFNIGGAERHGLRASLHPKALLPE